jgi:hypothetical protein
VSPDPFGGREVPIEIAAVEMPNRRFASDDDLRSAMQSAPWTTLRGTVRGKD